MSARWLLSPELEAAEEEDEVVPALGAWLPLAAHWLQDCSLACVLFAPLHDTCFRWWHQGGG